MTKKYPIGMLSSVQFFDTNENPRYAIEFIACNNPPKGLEIYSDRDCWSRHEEGEDLEGYYAELEKGHIIWRGQKMKPGYFEESGFTWSSGGENALVWMEVPKDDMAKVLKDHEKNKYLKVDEKNNLVCNEQETRKYINGGRGIRGEEGPPYPPDRMNHEL